MRTIKAVIFDWAGTTVDYGSFAPVNAFVEAFKEYGVEPNIEEVRKPMGILKRDHIKAMLEMPRIRDLWKQVHSGEWDEADVEAVYQTSETSILKILKNHAEVKPGVVETIAKLREKKIKIGSTTGYTDEMMAIVTVAAKENGYAPDCWFSPNAVENMGRPYPYMIYKNMQVLQIGSVKEVVKVGDTVADIREGKNAGILSIGIIEGSSIMGLSESEFEQLNKEEKEKKRIEVRKIFRDCGADYTIDCIDELPELLEKIHYER